MTSDNACCDLNGDFILAIFGVKMRWSMIAIIHPDDNPEESGNLRHGKNLDDRFGTFNSFRRS